MKKQIYIILCILVVGILCFFAWQWWQSDSMPLPAQRPPVGTAPSATQPKDTKQEKTSVSESAIAFPSAGKVSILTELQAQIQEEELRARLKELQGSTEAVTLPVVSAPLVLPTPLEKVSPPKEMPPLPTAIMPTQPSRVARVVSVQGTLDSISATIRTASGETVTVRKGQQFSGGTVSAISREGVQIRRGNKNTLLPFE